ncbi:hypothetical protein QBC37DRAFT_80043 [Rhypophila decipiens]|uniref:Uncharacterized protein n=1 Tax=Rhypophila decipiens TaxID=261697 RepID=A0AAN6XZ42_9PEZI|nr:hypothetical protein QBC37DRAFT_80043 [Rhypophila decipiens]
MLFVDLWVGGFLFAFLSFLLDCMFGFASLPFYFLFRHTTKVGGQQRAVFPSTALSSTDCFNYRAWISSSFSYPFSFTFSCLPQLWHPTLIDTSHD